MQDEFLITTSKFTIADEDKDLAVMKIRKLSKIADRIQAA